MGVAKLDGQVLRPGETFSFNERIGPMNVAAGWVEGSIIIADKTERGIGGGICQISTTLFRAVLNAGLPIEERWPHLYRVRYYEMGDFPIGIDATIFIPGVDLKFGNDFDHPVMLRTRIDPRLAILEFEIWGVDDGRNVELVDHKLINWADPPPDEGIVDPEEDPDYEDQAEWSKKGVQAEITRVIRRSQNDETRSTFRSSYVAWPNRFIVGIDVAKARFPRAYNEWFDENPEEAARWGVGRLPGVRSEYGCAVWLIRALPRSCVSRSSAGRRLRWIVRAGAWRSLVARIVWDDEVASSNLAAPTRIRIRWPRCMGQTGPFQVRERRRGTATRRGPAPHGCRRSARDHCLDRSFHISVSSSRDVVTGADAKFPLHCPDRTHG